ncbi:TCR/Tet family MFS transporter [Crocinitomix catalasitica]|uniref:TCR/Tet family MFS transporter n=1 Tax=Crocinitomix catalasitica TaxID=184607 RepID=UPI001B8055CD|nr:TCR/Tet family MFS transporter [Crocinitomix catalasitica]
MDSKQSRTAYYFIFITILIDMIGIGIIIPVIPDLISQITGQSLSEAALMSGFLIMAYAVMQFLFAPVMGELSDRFGRKPILLLALLGLAIDYIIHALAPTILWLFIGRVLAGIFGASHTVATAYIADISTPETKAKNFGMIGAAFGLGFIIGPGIGGIIGGEWGPRAPFYVAAGFTLLNLILGLIFVPESLSTDKRRPIILKNMIPFNSLIHLGKYKSVIGLVLAYTLVNLAGQVMPSTWTFFTMERYGWSTSAVGLSLAVVGLLVAIVQAGLTGVLVKKFGNKKVITLGFTCWTVGMFAFVLASNQYLLYFAIVPYVLGGIAGPTIQSIVSNSVDDKEQGNLQGVMTSMVSITAIVGPLIYTSLFAYYTGDAAPIYFPGSPYLLGGIILVIGSIIATYSIRNMADSRKSSIEELDQNFVE